MSILTENGSYVHAIDAHGSPYAEWVNVHEPVHTTSIPLIESWNLKLVPI